MPGKRQPSLSWVMWNVLSPPNKEGIFSQICIDESDRQSLCIFFFFFFGIGSTFFYTSQKKPIFFSKLSSNCMVQKCWENENVFLLSTWFEGHKQSETSEKSIIAYLSPRQQRKMLAFNQQLPLEKSMSPKFEGRLPDIKKVLEGRSRLGTSLSVFLSTQKLASAGY